jgi:hypothetical protein
MLTPVPPLRERSTTFQANITQVNWGLSFRTWGIYEGSW